MVKECRAAGMDVEMTRPIDAPQVDPAVCRAAYRIVQEALTNVRRHAGPDASATVVVGYSPTSLTLTVTDDGTGPAAAEGAAGPDGDEDGPGAAPGPDAVEAGNGIAGMRHRAATFGGTVEVGPRASGGFEVRATIPLREEDVS
jgi:signal transduction histidine kinase